MTEREQLASDMAAAIGGYGQSFTWNPRTGDAVEDIPCVRRDLPTREELQEMGGFIEEGMYFIVVAKGEFYPEDPLDSPVFPAIGDAVNNMDRQIKWMNGLKDSAAVQLVLACGTFDH